jgi:hypothetical protein
MQEIIFTKKSSKRNQTPLRYHNFITNPIPSFNTIHNFIFQKSSYKNRPTTWGSRSIKITLSIMNLNTISLLGRQCQNKSIQNECFIKFALKNVVSNEFY